MVDASTPQSLFGRTGSNKDEYINIVIAQRELYQGLIIWCYKTLMARDVEFRGVSADASLDGYQKCTGCSTSNFDDECANFR